MVWKSTNGGSEYEGKGSLPCYFGDYRNPDAFWLNQAFDRGSFHEATTLSTDCETRKRLDKTCSIGQNSVKRIKVSTARSEKRENVKQQPEAKEGKFSRVKCDSHHVKRRSRVPRKDDHRNSLRGTIPKEELRGEGFFGGRNFASRISVGGPFLSYHHQTQRESKVAPKNIEADEEPQSRRLSGLSRLSRLSTLSRESRHLGESFADVRSADISNSTDGDTSVRWKCADYLPPRDHEYSWEDVTRWVAPSRGKLSSPKQNFDETGLGGRGYRCRTRYSWQTVGTGSQTSRTLLDELLKEENEPEIHQCAVKYSWQIVGIGTQTSALDYDDETHRFVLSVFSNKNSGGSGGGGGGSGSGERSYDRSNGNVRRNGRRYFILNNQCVQTFAHKENQTNFYDIFARSVDS